MIYENLECCKVVVVFNIVFLLFRIIQCSPQPKSLLSEICMIILGRFVIYTAVRMLSNLLSCLNLSFTLLCELLVVEFDSLYSAIGFSPSVIVIL